MSRDVRLLAAALEGPGGPMRVWWSVRKQCVRAARWRETGAEGLLRGAALDRPHGPEPTLPDDGPLWHVDLLDGEGSVLGDLLELHGDHYGAQLVRRSVARQTAPMLSSFRDELLDMTLAPPPRLARAE